MDQQLAANLAFVGESLHLAVLVQSALASGSVHLKLGSPAHIPKLKTNQACAVKV